jgi:hypothetical protein
LAVLNLGYDADSTAAIYGQLAGAFYGAPCDQPPSGFARFAAREKVRATFLFPGLRTRVEPPPGRPSPSSCTTKGTSGVPDGEQNGEQNEAN